MRLEWARIRHAGGRTRVRAALKAELRRLAGVVGVEQAPALLAERLGRRLAAQHGEPVREPVGWLLSRGLPQRAECYASTCDDRVRMDTGAACASCDLLIADRQAVRHKVVQAVAAELPRLTPAEARAEVERRLNRDVALRAEREAIRHERAVVERARREEARAQQRQALAAEKAQSAARACEECGVPEADGLCLVCTLVRAAREAVEHAAQLAAVASGPLQDLDTAAPRLAACRERLEAEVGRAAGRWRSEGMTHSMVAWEVQSLAERLLGEERTRSLECLLASSQAREEAEQVFALELAKYGGVRASAAAERARQRCAERLLAQRLAEVRSASRPVTGLGGVAWLERLAVLAVDPLDGEICLPQPAASGYSEAVSVQ
ncbi:hypothetical protein ACFVUW_11300 [Streptomyces xiamenensis]|uniref:hypothetical protein n=1 Tax=Streptomyces xiamenensis TaxID=408015 RepID=UPI0036E3DE40